MTKSLDDFLRDTKCKCPKCGKVQHYSDMDESSNFPNGNDYSYYCTCGELLETNGRRYYIGITEEGEKVYNGERICCVYKQSKT